MGTPWGPHGNPHGAHGAPWGPHGRFGAHGSAMGPHGVPMGPLGPQGLRPVGRGPRAPAGAARASGPPAGQGPRACRAQAHDDLTGFGHHNKVDVALCCRNVGCAAREIFQLGGQT